MKRIVTLVALAIFIVSYAGADSARIVTSYESPGDVRFPEFTLGIWDGFSQFGTFTWTITEDGALLEDSDGVVMMSFGHSIYREWDEPVVTIQEGDSFLITWATSRDEDGNVYHEPDSCGAHQCYEMFYVNFYGLVWLHSYEAVFTRLEMSESRE